MNHRSCMYNGHGSCMYDGHGSCMYDGHGSCMMAIGHVCMMVIGHVCSIPSAAASLKNSNPSKMSCSRPIAHAVAMSCCCCCRDLLDNNPSHLPINRSHLPIHLFHIIHPSIHSFIDLSIHLSHIMYHPPISHLFHSYSSIRSS